ncbi:hypothetical protein [Bradyrhizobium sp. USDA 4508]
MRVTIVVDDNLVIIDGRPAKVDLSPLKRDQIHAVQWYGAYGEVEFRGGFDIERKIPTGVPNKFIDNFGPYQRYVDAHHHSLIKQAADEKAAAEKLEAEQKAIAEKAVAEQNAAIQATVEKVVAATLPALVERAVAAALKK